MFKGRPGKITDILSIVSEEQLLSYYLSVPYVPCTIQAPYRTDNNPSLSLYYKNNRVRFHDFATGEGGDIIDLLSLILRLQNWEVIDRIVNDLDLIKKKSPAESVTPQGGSSQKRNSKVTSIEVKVRPWKQYDLDYWGSQGVDRWFLDISGTYAISSIFFYREDKVTIVPADKYAYVYTEWKDGKLSKKIYQPFSERMKWISTHDHSVWDLWSLLPKQGGDLIITSSRKDAMAIWCTIDVPATSLQGEGYIPKPQVIDDLKRRFERIFVLYDNDFSKERNWGREDADKICRLYGLKRIEIPSMYRSKDPSDLVKNHGRKLASFVLNSLLGKQEELESESTAPF